MTHAQACYIYVDLQSSISIAAPQNVAGDKSILWIEHKMETTV